MSEGWVAGEVESVGDVLSVDEDEAGCDDDGGAAGWVDGAGAGWFPAAGRGATGAGTVPPEVWPPDTVPAPEFRDAVAVAVGDWLAAGEWLGLGGTEAGPLTAGPEGTPAVGRVPWVSVIVLPGPAAASTCQPMTATAAAATPPPVQASTRRRRRPRGVSSPSIIGPVRARSGPVRSREVRKSCSGRPLPAKAP